MKDMDHNIYYELEASFRGIGHCWYKDGVSLEYPPNDHLHRLHESLSLKIKNSQAVEAEYIYDVIYQVGFLDNRELKEIITSLSDASEAQVLFLQKNLLKDIEAELQKNKKRH